MKNLIFSIVVAISLAGCSNGSFEQRSTDQAAVAAQAGRDLALTYNAIGAFCLNVAEGRGMAPETLTAVGFRKFQNSFERTWSQGSATTGLKVVAKTSAFEAKGCSIQMGYDNDFDVLPLGSTQPIRGGLVSYLASQGFRFEDAGNQNFRLAASDGAPLLEFEFGRSNIVAASRGDTQINLASYERDGILYEFLELEDNDGLVF